MRADRKPIIHVESPLAPQRGDPGWPSYEGDGLPAFQKAAFESNVEFAKKVCHEIARAGGNPIAPHLYFTRFLNDFDPTERAIGLECGIQLQRLADEVWFTLPGWRLGFSSGMNDGLDRAVKLGIPRVMAQMTGPYQHGGRVFPTRFEYHLERLRRGNVELRHGP